MKCVLPELLTWAEIDLDAIAFNVRAVKKFAGKKVEVIAVVKANAYGHGAVPVAQAMLAAGANRLAVHRAIEGVELRKAGIEAPILVMGYTPPSGAKTVAQWKLTPSVITQEFAQTLATHANTLGVTVPVHVKVDTGLSRYGLLPAEVVDFLRFLSQFPALPLEGLFTHFATAFRTEPTSLHDQLNVFQRVLATVRDAGIQVPLIHAANSAALMKLPEANFNAVRPGIALYGMNPLEACPPVFKIQAALTLKSRVSRVRELPPGTGVGYDHQFITQQPTLAALVSAGYGDGYRRLPSKGSVLVRGKQAPILGIVCMDQFVVDVGGIRGVQEDDEVVLVGKQGKAKLSAEQVAEWSNSINYEITTALLPRVTRVYLRQGEIESVSSLA